MVLFLKDSFFSHYPQKQTPSAVTLLPLIVRKITIITALNEKKLPFQAKKPRKNLPSIRAGEDWDTPTSVLNSSTMLTRYRLPLITLMLLALAIGAAYLYESREPAPPAFDNQMGVSVISPPIALPAVTLKDQHNTPFQLDELEDEWSLMFFGFTHCPDICPTTLMTLKQAARRLPQQGLNYVFVTLDPTRDTPATIKEFLEFFDPSFIGLTGDPQDIDRLAQRLGIIYDYEGDLESGDYLVNHYAAILVIDPRGRLRAHILPPHPVDKVVEATRRLMDHYGN